jgi:hypothetical protein
MISNILHIILYAIFGYILFELLKIALAYPIGALSGHFNWDPNSAILLNSYVSVIVAGAAVVILIYSRLTKSGDKKADGKGDKG